MISPTYVQRVLDSFRNCEGIDGPTKSQALLWLGGQGDAVNLQRALYPTSRTRYRFPLNNREQVLKAIFENAVKENGELIEIAERESGRSFYPLWKRVCWIHIPNIVSSIVDNVFLKVTITIAVFAAACFGCYYAYTATIHFTAAVMIPFLINNTPLQITRIFNATIDLAQWIIERKFTVLISAWLARTIILWGPEIPYLTAAARAIDIYQIYLAVYSSPQNIGNFAVLTGIDFCNFTWNSFTDISLFFRDIAMQAEAERASIAKQEACNLWIRSCPVAPQLRQAL